jgi:mRNA interferase RelE/StbE
MNYTVELTLEAEKSLARIDRSVENRIRKRLRELSADPYSNRLSKPLKMMVGECSARVGNWRILYELHDNEKVLKVLAIRPRQEAYRKL